VTHKPPLFENSIAMTDLPKPSALQADTPEHSPARARRPYEPPLCVKKRSIHRVTLTSGMGVMSMGVLSMTAG
jgi:hypothetical protein